MRWTGMPSFSGIKAERSNFLHNSNFCSVILASKPTHKQQLKTLITV